MAYQSNYTGSQIDAGISKTTKMTANGDNITFAGKVTVSAEPTGDMDVVNKGYLSNVSGITEEIKQALLQCFQKVAWIDDQGQDYYDALYDALYPPVDLSSISCVYTQSGTVYDTDTLDSLKSDLVVTAHYEDSTTETVTAYTLSGTLAEGTSTITVMYGGKSTTFDVVVSTYLMYSLENTTITVDDSIATGVTLIETDMDFSICFDIDFTAKNGAYKIFRDWEDASPWRGLTMGSGASGTSSTNLKYIANYEKLDNINALTVTNIKAVITHVAGSGRLNIRYKDNAHNTITAEYINESFVALTNASENGLIIGKHGSSNTWTGTINRFYIYSRALSTTEADGFITGT